MSEFLPLSQAELDRRNARIVIDEFNGLEPAFEAMVQASIDKVIEVAEADRERYGRNWATYPDAHLRPFVRMGKSSKERPKRPNDISLLDLVPGLRLVRYNDVPINKEGSAQHWVVLGYPYAIKPDQLGGAILAVAARRVAHHSEDDLPIDPAAPGSQAIPLTQWGIEPNSTNDMYDTTVYVEPFVAKTDPRLQSTLNPLDDKRYN